MLRSGSERIIFDETADPASGAVHWQPVKSLWISTMTVVGVFGAPLTFSWGAFFVFLLLAIVTLCAGHSVGMHRRLIHNSFECPLWVEYFLVWLGVLVGMAGPFGMMRQHDLRDWAQRQTSCHDYLCHRRGIWIDYFWQCHCDVSLDRAPRFELERRISKDSVYRWLERTWMLQQAPIAIVLFVLGGWSFVIWGVALRVAVSVTGHWLVGYFAHHEFREGNDRMSWRVRGACVQGRDVPIAGLISMGESWHNNHHAYPGSAKIGLLPGQPDPGWQLIQLMRALGLAWNIRLPTGMPERQELLRLGGDGTGWRICSLRKRLWATIFKTA